MKRILIYFISIIALIVLQYFLSIVLVLQIATKRMGDTSSGFKDVLIIIIWLSGIVSIIYMIIKFLIIVYRHK